jgi:hypothetical protein
MKVTRFIPAIASALALVALPSCGNKTDSDYHHERPETKAPVESGLPDAAVIAVPLDQNNQEMTNRAELRVIPNSPESLSGEQIMTAYENGRRPDRMIDEMDATSSSESFQGWGNYRHVGQPGFGYGGFNQYQPIYYHGGNPFSWRFFNQHRCGNTNYYYYHRRPQPWQNQWNRPVPGPFNPGAPNPYGPIQPIGYY